MLQLNVIPFSATTANIYFNIYMEREREREKKKLNPGSCFRFEVDYIDLDRFVDGR